MLLRLFICMMLFVNISNADSTSPVKRALVIGNSNYNGDGWGRLINPVNDARDMKTALESVGFHVILALDLDRRSLKRAVNKFAKTSQKGDTVVVYYSGHGAEYNGKNYLIPLGAEIGTLAHLDDEGISLQYVLETIEVSETGVNIIILDACRNSPQIQSARSRGRGASMSPTIGLANESGPSGSLIAYAASGGKTASDGKRGERNSPYVKYLKQEIIKPGLPVFQMFTNVRLAVRKETNNNSGGPQEPTFYSELNENFCFAGCPNAIPPVAIPQSPIAIPQIPFTETLPVAIHQVTEPTISDLLVICEEHLSADRLTTGNSGNAFECYQEVLLLEPENLEALSGLEAIEIRYKNLAQKMLRKQNVKKAKVYLKRLKTVNINSKYIVELEKEIKNFRQKPVQQAKPAKPTKLPKFKKCTKRESTGVYTGRCIKTSKNVYIPHGKGVLRFNNGQIFRGKFRKGKQHGWGVHTWPDGYTKKGVWNNGRPPP